MNRQPTRLSAVSKCGAMAALVRIRPAARAISTNEAPLVPTAVIRAWRRPALAAVLTTRATTGPGVAINSVTVNA
ncbi:hypothetical protein D3C72_1843970 [compost metagenome]